MLFIIYYCLSLFYIVLFANMYLSLLKHFKLKKNVGMLSKKGEEHGRDEWNEKTVGVSSTSE